MENYKTESELAGLFGVSQEQANALLSAGNLFLRACPGSGKTRSVAARVAWQLQRGQRLALLSHTKIGAQEIASAASRTYGAAPSGENYIGTLHAFLLKYVLRPWGHVIANSVTPLSMNPERAQEFAPEGIVLADWKSNLQGTLYSKRRVDANTDISAIVTAKNSAAKAGYVSYDDAIYLCTKILNTYPLLAGALASRFDEIIVDEAQDTNVMQLECLRLIAETKKLASIVLVGDYDQTIFEFGGSDPDACEKFALDLGLRPEVLRENYRSSQLICDIAAHFRPGVEADVAMAEHATLDLVPRLFVYPVKCPEKAVAAFDQWLEVIDTPIHSKAVLARAGELAAKLRGGQSNLVSTAPFAELLQARKLSPVLDLQICRDLERLVLDRAFDGLLPLDVDSLKVRNAVLGLIATLPDLSGDLGDWAQAASAALDECARAFRPASASELVPLKAPASWRSKDAEAWKREPDSLTLIDTIHKAKGLSIDAVLVVGAVPPDWAKSSNANDWSMAINCDTPTVNEELRLAYVAVTRARKVLALALPSSTRGTLLERYELAGFEVTRLD